MDAPPRQRTAVGPGGGQRGHRLPTVLVGAPALRQQLRLRGRLVRAADLVRDKPYNGCYPDQIVLASLDIFAVQVLVQNRREGGKIFFFLFSSTKPKTSKL